MKYSKGYRVKVIHEADAFAGRTGTTMDDETPSGHVVVFLDAAAPGESPASRSIMIHSSALGLIAQPSVKVPDEFDATAVALGITREQVQQEMGKVFAIPDSAVVLDAPGYESLARVMARAFTQASSGKGAQRHGQGQPFDAQPMQSLIELYGVGFALGQAGKKAQESQRLEHSAAIRELLGAINYLAGAVIAMERAHHA